MRLKENIKILQNFKELRSDDKSRSQYLEEVKTDVCSAFDYNPSLCALIFDLFAPSEALEFIEANEN
jgi:ribosomal RNA methyltransferase Nop2